MQSQSREPPRPQKQGGLYSLNLGQNNGPYLSKDVMPANQKSTNLIGARDDFARSNANVFASVAQQSLTGSMRHARSALDLDEPPDYYDEKLKAYTNYDEKYKAKLNAAENLACNSTFAQQAVLKLQQNFEYYKSLIASYRKDLEKMHEDIHNSNMNNIREIQPMLKDFHQRLKDNLHAEKNEHYKLQRELEQLNREKLHIQQQILFSHKRILDLEKMVGLDQPKEIDPNRQDDDVEENEEMSEFEEQ